MSNLELRIERLEEKLGDFANPLKIMTEQELEAAVAYMQALQMDSETKGDPNVVAWVERIMTYSKKGYGYD